MSVRLALEGWSRHPRPSITGDALYELTVRHEILQPVDGVDLAAWEPIEAPAAAVGLVEDAMVIDGVMRQDARIVLHVPDGTIGLGVLASVGVMSSRHRPGRRERAEYGLCSVDRSLLHGVPRQHEVEDIRIPATPQELGGLSYRAVAWPGADLEALHRRHLEGMRASEDRLAAEAARMWPRGLVVVDGVPDRWAPNVVGVLKSVGASSLHPVLARAHRLRPGQRSPVYVVSTPVGEAMEWVVAMAFPAPWGHPWSHVVRCRIAPRGVGEAGRIADWAAVWLPRLATEPHRDARAPQQLVPVAAIEQEARRRLGDQIIIHRRLLRHLRTRG